MAEFIMANLPILLCFIVGIGFLVAEAFMPGFGVAGISGIVLELVAIVITYMRHGAVPALILTLVVLMVLAFAISMSLRSVRKGRLSRSNLVLNERESAQSATDTGVFIGKTGRTSTALRPSGVVDLDGVRLNVMTEGDFIGSGEMVRVVRTEGSKIIVKKEEENKNV